MLGKSHGNSKAVCLGYVASKTAGFGKTGDVTTGTSGHTGKHPAPRMLKDTDILLQVWRWSHRMVQHVM